MGLEALVGDLDHHPAEEAQPALGGRRHGGAGAGTAEGAARRLGSQAAELADQREQAGQEDVEVVGEQRGAAGRAADAHVTRHPDVLAAQQAGELAELGAFVRRPRLALAGEGRIGLFAGGFVGSRPAAEVGDQAVERRAVARAGIEAQQVAHQPAAGVGDEVQPRARRQHRDELQGVVHRALGEGAVLEAVDVLAELFLQVGPGLAAGQGAEAAEGVGAGAVDEDQRRPACQPGEARVVAAQPLAFGDGAAGPGIEPRRPGELLLDHRDDGPGAQAGGAGHGEILDLAAQPFGGPGPGEVGEGVRLDGEGGDLPPQPLAEPPAGRVPGAEGREVDGAVRADQAGLGEGEAAQPGGQLVGADEQRGAVGGLQGQQAAVGIDGGRAGGLFTAAGTGEGPGLQRGEDVGQQRGGGDTGGAAAGHRQHAGEGGGARAGGRGGGQAEPGRGGRHGDLPEGVRRAVDRAGGRPDGAGGGRPGQPDARGAAFRRTPSRRAPCGCRRVAGSGAAGWWAGRWA